MKNKLVAAIVLALVTFAFVGCSKDDDNPQTGGSIDAAVGTYKGKLEVIGQPDRFDQTIVVTKVSDSRIKVAVGDASLNLPTREFNVSNEYDVYVRSASLSTGGTFVYEIKEKSVVYQAEPTAQGEVLFTFKGDKQ